jgi:hypothetical protein
MLLDNTRAFQNGRQEISPITGSSCWALGYLDPSCRLVGCLLHPCQNAGRDLRYLVGYGEKCRRETCQAAKGFLKLDPRERGFWLHLTEGLDTFSYSSQERNPLFRLMGWGTPLLRAVASDAGRYGLTADRFFQSYPFFSTHLDPRGNAYLIHALIQDGDVSLLKAGAFRSPFEDFSVRLSASLKERSLSNEFGAFTHRLPLDETFLDFLRLQGGITKISLPDAVMVKAMVDRAIEAFKDGLGRISGQRPFHDTVK